MHHDHPVVPRPQIDALLAKVAEKRARRELAQRELRPDEEEGDLFQRVFTRGSRLARKTSWPCPRSSRCSASAPSCR